MRDLDRVAVINKISPSKFIDGGAAILTALKRNHHIVMVGIIVKRPLVRKRLRVFDDSWVIAAKANRAGEHRPCANIIVSAPFQPHDVSDIKPVIMSAMCATEEYAIRAFTSVWRMQMSLVRVAPHIESLRIKGMKVDGIKIMVVRRIKP